MYGCLSHRVSQEPVTDESTEKIADAVDFMLRGKSDWGWGKGRRGIQGESEMREIEVFVNNMYSLCRIQLLPSGPSV